MADEGKKKRHSTKITGAFNHRYWDLSRDQSARDVMTKWSLKIFTQGPVYNFDLSRFFAPQRMLVSNASVFWVCFENSFIWCIWCFYSLAGFIWLHRGGDLLGRWSLKTLTGNNLDVKYPQFFCGIGWRDYHFRVIYDYDRISDNMRRNSRPLWWCSAEARWWYFR